jgi:DNA-binding NtrC family response regulator
LRGLVCAEEVCPVPHVTEAALNCLRAYPWPGNVRRLRAVLNQAVVQTSQGIPDPEHLPAYVTAIPVPGVSMTLTIRPHGLFRALFVRSL